METGTKLFSNIKNSADFNLSAEFNISIDKKKTSYIRFMDKTFCGHKRELFEKVVQIRNEFTVLKGQLYYKSIFNGQLTLSIATKDITSKIPLTYFEIIDPAISPEYLLWFLDHKQVIDYLTCFSVGTVIVHIPKQAFNLLTIPYPKQGNIKQKKTSVILQPENNAFKVLISQYYQQYKYNYDAGNYLTAAILAGAITETHLFVFLTDTGISTNALKQKTLGALIDLAEAYLLNSDITDFPLTDFKDIQKIRNRAVHPVINSDNQKEINQDSFGGFKRIIKYFGL